MDRLDRLVSENRFTIAVLFPLVGALMFVASAEQMLPGPLSFNPYLIILGTVVMRLPLIAGLEPLMDRKAVLGLSALTLYAYLVEYVGIRTGLPYGEFEYLVQLGPMVEGVPLGLPVFFIPLVLNSYLLVRLYDPGRRFRRIVAVIAAVLLIDAVLDPAAVSLGIWTYASGIYYGVPVQNFLGWVLSAAVATLLLEYSLDGDALSERLVSTDFMLDDMVSFTVLWGLVNLYYFNIAPFLVAALFAAALWNADRFSFAFQTR